MPSDPGEAEPETERYREPPSREEVGALIGEVRQLLVLLRPQLPTPQPELPSPPLTPVPPSRRQAAALVVTNAAKWTTIAVGVLGLAAQVAAAFKPGLVGPIQTLIQLLGGSP